MWSMLIARNLREEVRSLQAESEILRSRNSSLTLRGLAEELLQQPLLWEHNVLNAWDGLSSLRTQHPSKVTAVIKDCCMQCSCGTVKLASFVRCAASTCAVIVLMAQETRHRTMVMLLRLSAVWTDNVPLACLSFAATISVISFVTVNSFVVEGRSHLSAQNPILGNR
eukprot:4076534-Amphidinium_carterae.1